MLVLSKEVQQLVSACEYLLSTVPSLPLSDAERLLIEYYIQELSEKYGLPKEDGACSATSFGTRHESQAWGLK